MPSRRRFFRTFAVAPLVAASARAEAAPTPAVPAWPDDSDPEFWDRIRDQFYIKPGEAYFNTGTIGATPRPVLERVIEDMRTLQATITRWDWSPNMPNWISGYSPEVALRQKLAKLVNADAMEIALIQNATMGMNFIAHGIELKAGDEIITTNQEHPGGVCGWQMRAKRDGAVWKSIQMPIPANDPDELVRLYEQQITPRTRVLSFPHIISPSAVVMPVKRLSELAHAHGCLAIVDGAHAIGQVKVDMKEIGCDAYFASPHKWLLAPPGNGMLYIPREKQDLFWTTLDSSEWDNHKDGMYRFMQYGTGNMSLLSGLDAAIDFHNRIGPERVRARIRFLADRLRSGLQQIPNTRISSPVHPELAGGIVVHHIEGVPAQKLQDELWLRKQLRVRSVGDPLGVRQSCMIYNSEAEIDATLEIVKALAAKQA